MTLFILLNCRSISSHQTTPTYTKSAKMSSVFNTKEITGRELEKHGINNIKGSCFIIVFIAFC